MIYTRTTEYALRALAYLSSKEKGVFTGVREVAEKTNLPNAYIAKILRVLAQSKILIKAHGRNGGFSLNGNAQKLTIMDVILAIDNPSQSPFSKCIMGLRVCGDKNPCPLHFIWVQATQKMKKQLKKTALQNILLHNERFPSGKQIHHSTLARAMKDIFKPKIKEHKCEKK